LPKRMSSRLFSAFSASTSFLSVYSFNLVSVAVPTKFDFGPQVHPRLLMPIYTSRNKVVRFFRLIRLNLRTIEKNNQVNHLKWIDINNMNNHQGNSNHFVATIGTTPNTYM
jgi:hypothetical protein